MQPFAKMYVLEKKQVIRNQKIVRRLKHQINNVDLKLDKANAWSSKIRCALT